MFDRVYQKYTGLVEISNPRFEKTVRVCVLQDDMPSEIATERNRSELME